MKNRWCRFSQAVVVGWIGLCFSLGSQAAAEAPIKVRTALVDSQTWPIQWQGPAEIGAEQALTLKTEVAGRIKTLNLKEGQKVKTGQLLIELDDSLLQAELAQQELEQQLTAKEFKRQQQLHAREATTQQSLDEAEGRWQLAQAKKVLIERQQQKTRILAPFDGTLAFRQVSLGDYVSPGQALIDLVDTEHLWLEARLPQHWLSRLKLGQQVEFTADLLDQPVISKIDRIAPAIAAIDRAIPIRAKVENPDQKLKAGLFGRAEIRLTEQTALTVPELAILTEPQGPAVFRIEQGKVEKVRIRRGENRAGQVQVLSGLDAKQRVVLAPPARLKSGMAIEEER